jgi:hypothetical protein
MRRAGLSLKTAAAFALGCLAPSAPAAALRGLAQALEAPGLRAEDIALLAAPGAEDGLRLELKAGRVRLEALALELPDVSVSCALEQRAGALHCAGSGGWRWGAERIDGALELSLAATKTLHLRWRRAPSAVELTADLEKGVAASSFEGLPVMPLSVLTARIWPELLLQEGVAEGRIELDLSDAAPFLRGAVRVAPLAFDTRDGTAGALGAAIAADFRAWLGQTLRAEVEARVAGGEWLLGPLYLELGHEALAVAAALSVPAAGGLGLERLRLAEPGVFALEGELVWSEGSAWPEGQLSLRVEDASRFLARRAASLLALGGFAGLEGSGSAAVRARLDEGRLVGLGFEADALGLRDPKGRFALEGLQGSFELAMAPRAPESELSGRSASFFGIEAGPWRARLRSGAHSLTLAAPMRIELLGGALILEEGRIAIGPDGAPEATVAIAVERLALGELTGRFGWPRFPGTVSGRLPRAHYRAGRLESEGALEIAVFDGRVVAQGLALERPFGILPTLSADLRLERLDLARITGVFDFGLIEGRLSGRIDGLRLIDWKPVAFSARLATESSGRRRISQRAVENLAALGGGGAAAALQRGIVGAFSTFAYEELGLSCVLARHVCTMGGVGSAGDGYFILRGRGIPRVDVIGHQREVDWPVLIARLQAAVSSGAVVVE